MEATHLHYDPTVWYGTTADVLNKGLVLGQVFIDKRGYKYQLAKLDTALAGAKTVAKTVMVYKDPEARIVTDDRSLAFTIGGSPCFAGVILGAFEPSGTTNTTDRIVALLIDGKVTGLKTDGGDDIVEGDLLVVHATNDGGVDRLNLAAEFIPDPADAPASADILRDDLVANAIPKIEAVFRQINFEFVGWALDDDIDAADTVDAWVKKRFF